MQAAFLLYSGGFSLLSCCGNWSGTRSTCETGRNKAPPQSFSGKKRAEAYSLLIVLYFICVCIVNDAFSRVRVARLGKA